MLSQALSNLFRQRNLSDESTRSRERPEGLREELGEWQIFFIAISTVIGVTVFYSDGKALQVAGPGGALLAFAAVGVVAICVMECVSELIQMFPTPNAIVEFIRIFVDEDLAWVIGIGYWFTYAAIFSTQIIAAANFSEYWHFSAVYQTGALYIFAAAAMLAINYAGILTFGWIETIGGLLKIIIVVGGGIAMYVIHARSDTGSKFIKDGFRNNHAFASNTVVAFCYVVPIIAYGFLGVESVTVIAYEARDLKSIRLSSQYIAYVCLALYLFCAIGEFINVEWTNTLLPLKYVNPNMKEAARHEHDTDINSSAIIVIAAFEAGQKKIAGVLNGCIMFSALSAANSSLYVASRVLYGMTRDMNPRSPLAPLKGLGRVWNKTGVPVRALWVSFGAFVWLPFLRWKGGIAVSDLFEIFSVSASVSCLLAWAALCVAFLRYWIWFRIHKEYIRQRYAKFYRMGSVTSTFTFLEAIQPVPAVIGLVGSLVIVFVFTSATWWDTPRDFRKVATAYGAPIVMSILFLISKAISRRPYVKLSTRRADLQRAIETLRAPKEERKQRQRLASQIHGGIERSEEGAFEPSLNNQQEEIVMLSRPANLTTNTSSREGGSGSSIKRPVGGADVPVDRD